MLVNFVAHPSGGEDEWGIGGSIAAIAISIAAVAPLRAAEILTARL